MLNKIKNKLIWFHEVWFCEFFLHKEEVTHAKYFLMFLSALTRMVILWSFMLSAGVYTALDISLNLSLVEVDSADSTSIFIWFLQFSLQASCLNQCIGP